MDEISEIKKLLGLRIKELRISKGLSQQKLAELINIDQRNLSCIECGSAFPSKCMSKLARALEVELDDLFKFSHLKLKTEEMVKYISESLIGLSEENIKIIYKLIKSMK